MGHRFFFPTWPKQKECVSDGIICCYDSCDCDPANLALCIRGEETCLCFDCKFCCASGDTPFPVGLVKEADYIFKLGLHCFTCGLKNPDMKKLCMIDCRCLCYQWAGQLPFGGKVPMPLLSYYGLSLLPNPGCFMPPPKAGDTFCKEFMPPKKGAPPAAIGMARR